jgi:hypothetical protein
VRRIAAVLAVCAAAACGRIVATSPPASEPDLFEQVTVAGVPVATAAKAARTLANLQYTTRRFGADSTWGWRSVDSIHVRLRYQRPSADSTRVVAEYWGKCEQPGASCLRGEFLLLATGISSEEAPPQ